MNEVGPSRERTVTEQTKPPPGYYTDGRHGDLHRWWDGERWTDEYAYRDGHRWVREELTPQNRELRTAGWVTAILFPIAGFVISIMLAARSDRVWPGIMATSVLAGFIWYLVIEAMFLSAVNSL